MIVYRLAKEKYKNDLSGRGAELVGGRWNSVGIRVLYTSSSRALCTTEIAVHTPYGLIPKHYFMISIEIPEGSITESKKETLPEHWRSFPHFPTTKNIGDGFINEGKYLVLKVPSAVVDGDYNYLINPQHSNFKSVSVVEAVPFSFDTRMFT